MLQFQRSNLLYFFCLAIAYYTDVRFEVNPTIPLQFPTAFGTNAKITSHTNRQQPTYMPSKKDLQYRLEYALLRGIIGFVRLFPLDTAVKLSAKGWRLLAPYGRRHKRALDNIALAFPDMPLAERERIIMAMWENLGRVMAETMQMDRILHDPSRFEVLSKTLLDRYHGKMGSAILLSMHTGNWEITMWPMVQAGAKPAGVYRLVKNPYVDQYLRDQRKELYPGGLFAKGRKKGTTTGMETARVLNAYVRQGGRLGFLADLYDRKGLPVPFFGHPAPCTPFPAMMARRLGARIWIGRSVRIGNRTQFELEMKELKVPRTKNHGEDIKAIVAASQAQFEEWIREHPEQWMWSNRKWG